MYVCTCVCVHMCVHVCVHVCMYNNKVISISILAEGCYSSKDAQAVLIQV